MFTNQNISNIQSAIHVWNNRKKTQQLKQNMHKYLILAHCRSIFYVHKASMRYAGWSLYPIWTKSIDSSSTYQYKNTKFIMIWQICYILIKFKKTIGIITQIWHKAKWCFTCVGNTWYLTNVPNMDKIKSFSYISQQIH